MSLESCGRAAECFYLYREFLWWSGVRLHLPYPVEPALIKMYGVNYTQPVQQWRWDLDPFLLGYCHYLV